MTSLDIIEGLLIAGAIATLSAAIGAVFLFATIKLLLSLFESRRR